MYYVHILQDTLEGILEKKSIENIAWVLIGSREYLNSILAGIHLSSFSIWMYSSEEEYCLCARALVAIEFRKKNYSIT